MAKKKMPQLNEWLIEEMTRRGYSPELELILALFLRAFYDYLTETVEMGREDARSARRFIFADGHRSFKWWIDVSGLDLDINYVRKYVEQAKESGLTPQHRLRISKVLRTNQRDGHSVELL